MGIEETYQNGVGEFEQYTKGIGKKLFAKMGHKGGGLGKNEQGITAPIEAKLRPDKRGLGFDGYEQAVHPAVQESNKKSVSRPSKSLDEKLSSKKASRKKACITAEELLMKKQQKGTSQVVQKIFDMRGPQVRILTNLVNLNTEGIARENGVPMPELQHYIRLSVDIAEHDKQKLDSRLRNEKKTRDALQKKKKKLQKEALDQKQLLFNMEEMISVLNQIDEKNSSEVSALESVAQYFVSLQKRFPDEYTLYNLSCTACSYALPLFIRMFQGWDPLQNPTHGTEVVSLWKKLLQGENSLKFSSTASSPYTNVVMEVVFHAVRISVTNTWQARDPEPMLRVLASWEELLPPSVLQSIIDTVVVPKISASVDSWDPCRETIRIDSWIHPWLPLLGHKLENCCHTICHRMASVLHGWHPRDMSAYEMISPWKTVFDPLSWEKLMVQYIVPKLLTVMHELEINPANQNLDHFLWVRTWLTAIPTHHMLQLMDVFFNKWQEVLYHWLCSKPNFEQVSEWYLRWKGLLPSELQANEHVQFRLKLGLEMMNQAVEGMEVCEQRKFETRKRVSAQAQHRAMPSLDNEIPAEVISGADNFNLKEVLEIHAQTNGLVFMPKPGRMQDGHQIYRFGNISIIIIDSLNPNVFALTEDGWSPVFLEQLLELQSCHKTKRHC